MATTSDPKAQKYDATQNLQVVGCPNNAGRKPDIEVAPAGANKEVPVGGVMDAASRMEEGKSTDKGEDRIDVNQAVQKILTPVLLQIFLPIVLGLYSVLSIQYTAAANDQSHVANQIALLSLCYSNSSSNFCAHLLAQTDLYLPNIANNLYGLKPTSGNRKSEPIAPLTPESAANITRTVFLKNSSSGTEKFTFLQYWFVAFAALFLIQGLIAAFSQIRKLRRRVKEDPARIQ